jgi:hypothetical protein
MEKVEPYEVPGDDDKAIEKGSRRRKIEPYKETACGGGGRAL